MTKCCSLTHPSSEQLSGSIGHWSESLHREENHQDIQILHDMDAHHPHNLSHRWFSSEDPPLCSLSDLKRKITANHVGQNNLFSLTRSLCCQSWTRVITGQLELDRNRSQPRRDPICNNRLLLWAENLKRTQLNPHPVLVTHRMWSQRGGLWGQPFPWCAWKVLQVVLYTGPVPSQPTKVCLHRLGTLQHLNSMQTSSLVSDWCPGPVVFFCDHTSCSRNNHFETQTFDDEEFVEFKFSLSFYSYVCPQKSSQV